MILFFIQTKSFAQDIPVKPDSLDLKTGIAGGLPKQADSLRSGQLPLRLPRLNPAENLLPQFTPYQRFTLEPQHSDKETNFPQIHWHGANDEHSLLRGFCGALVQTHHGCGSRYDMDARYVLRENAPTTQTGITLQAWTINHCPGTISIGHDNNGLSNLSGRCIVSVRPSINC